MSLSASSSTQSLASGIFGQIQQQQAQRNADQAEQQARSLQIRARQAQTVADRAQDNARSLRVQSGQAQGVANSAKRGLAAMESLGEVQTQLSSLREQISTALSPPDVVTATAAAVEPVAAVVNTFGQTTGTLVNVTA